MVDINKLPDPGEAASSSLPDPGEAASNLPDHSKVAQALPDLGEKKALPDPGEKQEEHRPRFTNNPIHDHELEEIARRHPGSNPGVLKYGADLMLANRVQDNETVGDAAKKLVTTVPLGIGNELLGGIPLRAIRQLAFSDPDNEAMNEVQHLVNKRKSYLQTASTLVASMGAMGAAGKTAGVAADVVSPALSTGSKLIGYGKDVATGAGVGAAYGAAFGYGESETGKAIEGIKEGAKSGALLGGGLSASIPPLVATVKAGWGLGKASVGVVKKMVSQAPDSASTVTTLERGQALLSENQEAEEAVKNTLIDSIKNPTTWHKDVGSNTVKAMDETSGLFTKDEYNQRFDIASDKIMKDRPDTFPTIKETEQQMAVDYVREQRFKLAAQLEQHSVSPAELDDVLTTHLTGKTGEEEMNAIINHSIDDKYVLKAAREDPLANVDTNKELPKHIALDPYNSSADLTDIRWGTNMGKPIRDIIINKNQSEVMASSLMKAYIPELKSIFKVFENTREDGKKLARMVEGGESYRDQMLPPDAEASQKLAAVFDSLHTFFEKLGVVRPKVLAEDGSLGYLPHLPLPIKEAQAVIKMEGRSIREGIIEQLSTGEHAEDRLRFTSPNHKEREYLSSVELLSKKEIRTPQDFTDALNLIQNKPKLVSENLMYARSTMQREGTIPDMIRDYNIPRLIKSYIADNFNYLNMRAPLRDLNTQIDVLRAKGAHHFADYWDTFKDRLLSPRESNYMQEGASAWRAKYTDQIVALQKQAESAKNPEMQSEIQKQIAAAQFKKDAPTQLTNILMNNIAGNLLGRPKAAMAELIRPFTSGINSLGGGLDASAWVTRGLYSAAKNIHHMGDRFAELESLGAISPKHDMGYGDLNKDYVASQNLWANLLNKAEKISSKSTQYLLAMRLWCDKVNRVVMLDSGRAVANDFFTGSTKAQQSARYYIERKAPLAIRTQVRDLLKKGTLTEEGLGNIIGVDAGQRSQVVYDKLLASQFSAKIGPLARFTRFGSGQLGNYAIAYERHGGAELAKLALLPTSALYLVGKAYSVLRGEGPETPREKRLTYPGGLFQRGPIPGIVEAIPSGAPELNMIKDILEAGTGKGTSTKALEGARNLVNPLEGWDGAYRDAAAIVTGEDPGDLFKRFK